MTRSACRPSAFHSLTALISRIAGSPRLMMATRWKAGRVPWLLIRSLAERDADVIGRRPGRPCCWHGAVIDAADDVQHHFVGDDGGVDAQHRVTADGAGPKAGREDPGRPGDYPVADGVVYRDRDARRRHVAHRLDVEVQLVGGQPSLPGQVEDHRLVGLVRDDQLDALQQRPAWVVRIALGAELVDHLGQVALHQGLDLGTVYGDVVVELRVRRDDRVDLTSRPARVGLHNLYVAGGAWGGRGDDHRRGAVPEDHPRGTGAADLVGELLHTDQQDGPLDFLQLPDRLGQPVGQPGAGRHQVDRGVRLQQAELPGHPARHRWDLPVAGAGAD